MKMFFKLAIAAALVAAAATANADTVILNSGARYDVPKAEVKDGQVHFELYGQPVAYDMSMIREVIHGPMPEKTQPKRTRRTAPQPTGRRITVPRDQAPSARTAKPARKKTRWVRAEGGPVRNSKWDGSVAQVKWHLEKVLKDPDSLEFIEWSPVVTDGEDFGVRVKYRAKNSFGGYVIENKLVLMDPEGDVIRMQDAK